MASKRKKKKKSAAPVILIILIAVAILCIVYFMVNGFGPNTKQADQNELFRVNKPDSAAIVINGELAEQSGKVIDGKYYIDYDTAWTYVNSGFYFEGDTLYRTIPSGTTAWKIGDGSGAVCRDADGTVYISAECIKNNSDIELEVYGDPARIVIRNNWDGAEYADVTGETQIRVRSDERSEIAVNAAAGEKVTVLERENEWSHVVSADGHSGYIKTSMLSEPKPAVHENDPKYIFESIQYPDTVRMGWHYIDSMENNQYLDGMLADTHGLNIISPTWFWPSDINGNIVSYASEEYVAKAHNTYGLSIWAMVNDYSGDDGSTGDILMDTVKRQTLINGIVEQALTYGLEGINIDFETITWEQAPAYLQFLRELTIAAHAGGLIVSVDNYVPTYTKQYKRAEQNKIVDYVVIMGYDEHTGASEEIGSVASAGFVEEGIIDTIAEVDPQKTVIAVPFYTRGWTEYYGKTEFESEILDMTEQQGFIDAHGIKTYWNENAGQNMGSAEGQDARYSIWVEDAQSIAKKLEFVGKYGIAGASCWRIGTETPDIWDVWEKYLTK